MGKPAVAVVSGDPARVGSELVAKLLAQDEVRAMADIVMVADRDEVEEGMRVANSEW